MKKMGAAPKRSRRGLVSLGGLVLVLILFVALNVAGNTLLRGVQPIDLTQERLFTLSPGTRLVLSQINEPVTLRFYYSERLGRDIPSYGVYAARVRELLQTYRSIAPGKVRLEVIDPLPFSDEEERAVNYGLQGVPVNQEGEVVYFGLAGSNSAGKDEVIGFFQADREPFLEYDVTRLIYNLASIRKPVLGVISTLPLWGDFRGMRQMPQPWAVTQQLDQFFTVRRLEPSVATIPEDVNVLMVVHPRDLPETTQYAIDQFVMRGGRALVFVDPHSEFEAQRGGMTAAAGTGSDLPRLFQAWGVQLVENRIATDRQAAVRVSTGASDTRVRAVDYVAWLQLRTPNFNTEDVLAADLRMVRVATAGILQPREGATTTMTPLMQTGPASMELDADQVRMMPDPVAILSRFQPSGERLIMAARITGPARSAFEAAPPLPAPAAETPAQPGQPPARPATPPTPAAPPTDDRPGYIAQARSSINVVVVADTDLLDDRFWVQSQDFFGQRVLTPTANNGDLVVNAVDNLSGSDGLISLRARNRSQRPFVLVQQIQGEAENRFRATERQLQERLRETEQRLTQLRSQGAPDQAAQPGAAGVGSRVLSREQQQAIDQFRSQVVDIRRQLRGVQQQLRQNIAGLETVVRFVNIGLLPILITLVALIVGLVKMRRRRRGTRFTRAHQGAAS